MTRYIYVLDSRLEVGDDDFILVPTDGSASENIDFISLVSRNETANEFISAAKSVEVSSFLTPLHDDQISLGYFLHLVFIKEEKAFKHFSEGSKVISCSVLIIENTQEGKDLRYLFSLKDNSLIQLEE